jgi:RimJ/RimL family protein N-acetyltransferase
MLERNALELSGGKLTLKSFREEDISSSYISWLNNKMHMKFSDQRHVRHSKESATRYLKTFQGTEHYFLAVFENKELLIGTVTIYRNLNNDSANIGIMISPDKSGQGIGKEIFTILLEHLPTVLNLHKITAGTCELNSGMISVLEKSGMELNHRISEDFKYEGRYYDNLVYAKFF